MPTTRLPAWSIRLLGFIILACILVPALLYWQCVVRWPGIPPEAVAARLAAGAVLVDLRTGPEAAPLPQAERHAAATLLALPAAGALPASLQLRPLILVDDNGMLSAPVCAHLCRLGVPAWSLEGGIDAWRCAAAFLPEGATPFPRSARTEPPWKQGLVILSGLVVKPLYMLLTLLLALGLRTATHPVTVALRWSLWLFLAGEVACALNLVFCHEASVPLDGLHGWGMALSVSAAAWAVLMGMSAPPADAGRCSWDSWCRPCSRPERCPRLRLIPLLPALVLVAALIPLSAGLVTIATTSTLAGQPYAYRHEMPQVIFELRILPCCAVLLAGMGLALALRGRSTIALACTALAAGPLSFSLLRLLLGGVWHDDPAWFLAWEELSEMAALLALWWMLPRRSTSD